MDVFSRAFGDSEDAVCHANCHMRNLDDQVMAFKKKTSNCCLTRALGDFAFEREDQARMESHGQGFLKCS